ncbi:MAG: hypothetical protein ACI9MR_001416 [Myxococcota bacterium]|jgi:hypothetical protein
MNNIPTTPQQVSRMRLSILTLIIALPGLLSAACGKSAEAPPTDTLSITVAPLTLDGVSEVTYGIRVLSLTETVWERTGLTSTQFGDGESALTYVGPCDASNNPHTIELTIEEIQANGAALVDPDDFNNPAPAGQPLRQVDVTCLENADVLVAFNVTVLRNARQGFFDIAVNFDNIFCSAKLDCRDELLFKPGTGDREATAIVALACTTGENTPTFMHASDLTLSCNDGGTTTLTYPLATGSGPGQHGPVQDVGGGAGVYEWATYQGLEGLTSNGEPLEKCYWNRAVGLDLDALQAQGMTSCTLSGIATASQSADIAAAFGGPGTSYPIIRWSVDVLSDGALCDNNPLNGPDSGVVTEYVTTETDPTTLPPLTQALECGAVGGRTVACGADATVREVGNSLTVTTSGGSLNTELPTGMVLADDCCVDGCCFEL